MGRHFLKRSIVLSAGLLLSSAAFCVSAQAADWGIQKVDSVDGLSPYCVMSTDFAEGASFSIAQNTDQQASLGFEFANPVFAEAARDGVDIILDPGAGGQVLRRVSPSSENTLVVRIGKDDAFFDALKRTGRLNARIGADKYDFNMPGVYEAKLRLDECLEAIPYRSVNYKDPQSYSNDAYDAFADETPAVVSGAAQAAPDFVAIEMPALQETPKAEDRRVTELQEQVSRLSALTEQLAQQNMAQQQKMQSGYVPVEMVEAKLALLESSNKAIAGEKSEIEAARIALEKQQIELEKARLDLEQKRIDIEKAKEAAAQQRMFDEQRLAAEKLEAEMMRQKQVEIAKIEAAARQKEEAARKALEMEKLAIASEPAPLSGKNGEQSLLAHARAVLDEPAYYDSILPNNAPDVTRARQDYAGDRVADYAPIDDVRMPVEAGAKVIKAGAAAYKAAPSVDAYAEENFADKVERAAQARFGEKSKLAQRPGKTLKPTNQYVLADQADAEPQALHDGMKPGRKPVRGGEAGQKAMQDEEFFSELMAEFEQLESQGSAGAEDIALHSATPEQTRVEPLQPKKSVDGDSMLKPVHLGDAGAIVREPKPYIPIPKRSPFAKNAKAFSASHSPVKTAGGFYKPDFQVQKFLESASVVTPDKVARVDRVSGPEALIHTWRLGNVYGSAEQRPVQNDSDFEKMVEEYLAKTQKRCVGDYAIVPHQAKSTRAARIDSYEIACISKQASSSASLLFVKKAGTFAVFAHEAAVDQMETAMSLRDRLSKAFLN